MSKLLDKICILRDIIADKKYDKLRFHTATMLSLKEDIHRQLKKKEVNLEHEIDFTSQDLRELAQELRQTLKYWDDIMCPDDNIRKIKVTNKIIDMTEFSNTTIPVMVARSDSIKSLIELLNIIEYYAVYLYYVEIATNDELVLKCTERLL